MYFDYTKLNDRIKEKFTSQANFAKKLPVSERSLSLKLNNKRGWKQVEISRACYLLDIDIDDVAAYFFTANVQRDEHNKSA